MSMPVVGAKYANANGTSRAAEILRCKPGELVTFKREPKNPADSRAIGVYSVRGVQIGYVRAEQAQWLGSMIRRGGVKAVFQYPDEFFGAVIRVAFDGKAPALPKFAKPRQSERAEPRGDGPRDPDAWPPPEPTDDFGGI